MSKGCCTHTPPALRKSAKALFGVGNHNVRLWPDLQVNDQLRVGLRKSEASRFIA
jgi:hypothetical protein